MVNLMTAQEFIDKFVYTKGVVFIDGWQRIDKGDGPYKGDCDDFALTVLILTEGGWLKALWALLTFQAMFWLVKSPVNGFIPRHAALWHRKYGWIDSTNREWRDTAEPHSKRLPLVFPWAYFRILWGFTLGRIF